jgi:hypothetical protein
LQKKSNSKFVFVTYLLIGIIGFGLGFISCLTWITYVRGELNWNSISILSNIVLVFALVIVTFWYASEVKRQTGLMGMDQKRHKILEEVQFVLTPSINSIKSEIKAIQHKQIIWHRYTSEDCGFSCGLTCFFYDKQNSPIRYVFNGEIRGALTDILEKFSDLKRLFTSHDSIINELNQLYVVIEKEIKTPELIGIIEELIEKFNENIDNSSLKVQNKPLLFVEYIINLEFLVNRIPNSIEPTIDFWDENKDELIKLRDNPLILDIGMQISSKLTQLRNLDETILKSVEKIREDYRKEYNFTDNEVEPFRGL